MQTDNVQELAINRFRQGNLAEAEKLFKNIIKNDPQNPEGWYYLGLIASRTRKYKIAVELFSRAINIKPDVEYYLNLGNVFCAISNYDAASDCYKKAIEMKPDFIGAYNNLGVVYEKKNDTDSAIKCYQEAIKIAPDYIDAYCNLGVAMNRKGNTDEALKCYFKVLESNPNHLDANYNLGIAYKDNRDIDNAIKQYEKTLQLNPNYMDAYLNLGIAYLLNKNFEQGWKYYEYRFTGLKEPKPDSLKPKWDGSSLEGKTIYVYHEQGIGDTIQFIRFLPMLDAFKPKNILFKCQSGLEQLFKINSIGAEIINQATPDKLIEFDTYIPLLSLPYHLKINEKNIPNSNKYLKADINKVIGYKQKFFNNDKFKIGIFWQGSTGHKGDKKRSIPLEYFYPLVKLDNVQLYSLQKGFGIEQLKDMPQDFNIINLGETFRDLSDTAAVIENLDMVIGIDSALAHLAGALCKPVWVILSTELEWRWFMDETNTAWYRSMRLFSPEINQDRVQVMNKMFNALREYMDNTKI